MSKPYIALFATFFPIDPNPIIPRTFPCGERPKNLDGSAMLKRYNVIFSTPLSIDSPIRQQFDEKYNVVCLDEISHAKFSIAECDALYLQSVNHNAANKEFIDQFKNCKIIANNGVGCDHIDFEYAATKGIWVSNTPHVVGPSTADLTIAHLLNITCRFSESERWLRETKLTTAHPSRFLGRSPQGKVLGIIGFGSIGKNVAKRAIYGFDMKVLYYKRNRLTQEEEKEHRVEYAELSHLFCSCDYICVCVPATKQTFHIIDRDAIAKMKDGVFIINTSRGQNIDEDALVEGLKSGKIAGAGLDVFENEPKVHSELWDIPNVSLTPHIGTATYEARLEMQDLTLKNIDSVLSGNLPLTPINHIKGEH